MLYQTLEDTSHGTSLLVFRYWLDGLEAENPKTRGKRLSWYQATSFLNLKWEKLLKSTLRFSSKETKMTGFPTAHKKGCFCSSCEDKREGRDIKQKKAVEERSAALMKVLGFPLVKKWEYLALILKIETSTMLRSGTTGMKSLGLSRQTTKKDVKLVLQDTSTRNPKCLS